MGTRAIINIHDGDLTSPVLTTLYRQYDGYPNGLGKDVHKAVGDATLVNGFPPDPDANMHNGMGCLAATLIKRLKHGIGNVYIYPPETAGIGEEYTYDLYEHAGRLFMCVTESGRTHPTLRGPLADMTFNY